MTDSHVDVLIIGAGISGIDMAHRISERCPELTYTIAEGRDRLGGTWDLFRYPGVRSDSDVYTLSFPFRPWTGEKSIVDGGSLLTYIEETARATGVGEHIEYGTRIVSADWDSAAARWRVTATRGGERFGYVVRFVAFCTGYYDYEDPYDPEFTGDFAGQVVHPQFWPPDLDHTGKRVVVIGSGATAVTVVPAMARDAAHVTMVQRTPTYVLAQPSIDIIGRGLAKVLPAGAAHRITRAKNTVMQWALFQACRRWPDRMRALLRKGAVAQVGSADIVDEHFRPPYDPWEQRLCIAPDGDLFKAIRSGDASVVTGRIERFVPSGVRLENGSTVEADIIVTATGLRLRLLGGIAISVDGVAADLSQSHAYHGTLLSGLPNLAVCIGYINLSWTVRADLTARFVARLLRKLLDTGADSVVPSPPADLGPTGPFMDMQSGYLARAADLMPRVTRRYPWAFRQNVLLDSWATNRAKLDEGLVFGRVRAEVDA
ncbi:monooxygenase flavin-binding family protein [Actinoplanes lobatus]|uniref:Cation diffusion facilitator CzcD-associated flavoprotein CzcO n=1 Tax=Actinoplanes lobatus TaxID=113568 RepID=A0A7W7MKL6_9ACTN|nr:NAD(P)/FAD-dependent oxidoreductase [Actinoplanes lobatus]MBB4753799.1 cation diffusion facilitator CzcD-associated flavoprotein CzcO [Actinoplanes lobatus]GGN72490.1 monooxygenase flavin-binding family protein [Actinoplanes lobatus]GIE42048.1 monooxygenase flavin-binding family protein [Actinoplanes lobatus]